MLGPVATVAAALAIINVQRSDAAVLDLSLRGEQTFLDEPPTGHNRHGLANLDARVGNARLARAVGAVWTAVDSARGARRGAGGAEWSVIVVKALDRHGHDHGASVTVPPAVATALRRLRRTEPRSEQNVLEKSDPQ